MIKKQNLKTTKIMERHDYDLKQREDDMINVLSEDVHARGYSVNIIFE